MLNRGLPLEKMTPSLSIVISTSLLTPYTLRFLLADLLRAYMAVKAPILFMPTFLASLSTKLMANWIILSVFGNLYLLGLLFFFF